MKVLAAFALAMVAVATAMPQLEDEPQEVAAPAAKPPKASAGQSFAGPSFQFNCPEPNGLFPDKEQCDLYYICTDNKAEAQLCEDGLVFDDSVRNKEGCKLPYNVDCGSRTFVQEPTPDIDSRCPRANGVYNHPDPEVCDKFITCDKGVAFEMPCAAPLQFDESKSSCVFVEQMSGDAKKCGDGKPVLKSIDGFTCPGKGEIGPQGLLHQHPTYPHPSDCQFFITCYFGKEPNKLGCPQGQVFDTKTSVCKSTEEVPECSCWYECGEDSKCPDSCNADCSCPSGNQPSDKEKTRPAPEAAHVPVVADAEDA